MRIYFKYLSLFLITTLLISGVIFRNNILNFINNVFSPISVVSRAMADENLKSTDDRINLLILGLDKRAPNNGAVTSVLTDTIIVVSVNVNTGDPVIVSIPRDVWIEQTGTKINAVYAVSRAHARRQKPTMPIEDYAMGKTVEAVENIVGIPIHYYTLIDFNTFKDFINSVGGIEVTVDEAFDDYKYPIEGMENASVEKNRYMHIHFNAGRQLMDGDTALQYARSRHSTNIHEQGDFARARRQQKIITALKDKILSSEVLFSPSKIKGLYDSYKTNVQSNISLAEILQLYGKYTSKDFSIDNITRIMLSDEPHKDNMLGSGLLVAPSQEERDVFFNGQYVLLPASKTFDQIHVLIRTELFK